MFDFKAATIQLSSTKALYLSQLDGSSNILELLNPVIGEHDEVLTLGEALKIHQYGTGDPGVSWVDRTKTVITGEFEVCCIEIAFCLDGTEDAKGLTDAEWKEAIDSINSLDWGCLNVPLRFSNGTADRSAVTGMMKEARQFFERLRE